MTKKKASGRLSAQAGASRTKRSVPLRAGHLCLDPEAGTVTQDGELLQLRPMEYQLLRTLMLHQGEILSREYLMNEVWKTKFVDDTRTLEVHMSHLRKRIKDDARNSVYLHTVRGVGYCFEWRGEAAPAR